MLVNTICDSVALIGCRRSAAQLLVASLSLLTIGCGADLKNPKAFPFSVVEEYRYDNVDGPVYPLDLDSDGWDELVYYMTSNGTKGGLDSYVIQSTSGAHPEQSNVDGSSYNQRPFLGDYDLDRLPELILPYTRNDSLFVGARRLVNKDEEIAWSMLVTARAGDTLARPGDVWDARVMSIDLASDQTGVTRLVAVVQTGLGLSPRGVYVFDPKTHELLDPWRSGAAFAGMLVADFDDDGDDELLLRSHNVRNGVSYNGLRDDASHLMLMEVFPKLSVDNVAKTAAIWRTPSLIVADDGKLRLLAVNSGKPDQKLAPIQAYVLDPKNLRRPIRSSSLDPLAIQADALDLDLDGTSELVILRSDGLVEIRDKDFRLVSTGRVPVSADRFGPILGVGPGREPYLSFRLKGGGAWITDRTLKPVARVPYNHEIRGAMRGRSQPPLLISKLNSTAYGFSLSPQPFYLWYRYRQNALLLFGLAGLFVFGLIINRNRATRHALRRSLDEGSAAVFHALKSGALIAENATARGLIDGGRISSDRLLALWPEMSALLAKRQAGPIWGRKQRLRVPGETNLVVEVEVLPDTVWRSFRQANIVRVTPAQLAANGDAGGWLKLARRAFHDIRTPLSTIRLAIHRLKSELSEDAVRNAQPNESDGNAGPSKQAATDGELPAGAAAYLKRIEDQIAAIDRQATHFLNSIDESEPVFEAVGIEQFLREVVDAIRPTLPPDIQLELHEQGSLPDVMLDRDHMKSVFGEIIRNAVSSSPNGGKIEIRVTAGSATSQFVDAGGRHVSVEFVDTGVGMSADVLSHIFESGFTTREDGTGLGMTISRRIVEGHGGSLTVTSEEGLGTIVTVYLPAV